MRMPKIAYLLAALCVGLIQRKPALVRQALVSEVGGVE